MMRCGGAVPLGNGAAPRPVIRWLLAVHRVAEPYCTVRIRRTSTDPATVTTATTMYSVE